MVSLWRRLDATSARRGVPVSSTVSHDRKQQERLREAMEAMFRSRQEKWKTFGRIYSRDPSRPGASAANKQQASSSRMTTTAENHSSEADNAYDARTAIPPTSHLSTRTARTTATTVAGGIGDGQSIHVISESMLRFQKQQLWSPPSSSSSSFPPVQVPFMSSYKSSPGRASPGSGSGSDNTSSALSARGLPFKMTVGATVRRTPPTMTTTSPLDPLALPARALTVPEQPKIKL